MKKATPHIAITPQALAGRQLPSNWRENAQNAGGTYDRRDLENLWKSPNWSSKLNCENVIRDARLTSWNEIVGEK
jgi:hypothetical protein